jgi:hypothetical protein
MAGRLVRRARRLLLSGDPEGAAAALEAALRRRPHDYAAHLYLSIAYLRLRNLFRAHRALACAREADPRRFDRQALALVAREGFDLDAVCGAPPPRTPEPALLAPRSGRAARRPAGVTPLLLGDCRDLDEYARFSAMPPISAAEVAETDWDLLLGDLQGD